MITMTHTTALPEEKRLLLRALLPIAASVFPSRAHGGLEVVPLDRVLYQSWDDARLASACTAVEERRATQAIEVTECLLAGGARYFLVSDGNHRAAARAALRKHKIQARIAAVVDVDFRRLVVMQGKLWDSRAHEGPDTLHLLSDRLAPAALTLAIELGAQARGTPWNDPPTTVRGLA